MSAGVSADDLPAHRSETVERYLEAIYYIQHEGEVPRPGRLAEWLGVSAPTVSVSLQRLARDGWIRIAGDRSVELSDAGTDAASTIVRRAIFRAKRDLLASSLSKLGYAVSGSHGAIWSATTFM